MSGKTSKLLRKIAHLSGSPDKFIKKEYLKMNPETQRAYILFAREMFLRKEESNGSTE